MTVRIAIVGAGPAGLAVASALLAQRQVAVAIDLVDRAAYPDDALRHGPASGPDRLLTFAEDVDRILGDSRVKFHGNTEIRGVLGLTKLRNATNAVVLATGAPCDGIPDVAGSAETIGLGTVTHVEAWLAGNRDIEFDELDLCADSVVFMGASPAELRLARVLAGSVDEGIPVAVGERLLNSERQVHVIDSRNDHDLGLEPSANVIVHRGITPIGIVGRHRARALRCLRRPDRYGLIVSEDVRAQLLLRPRAEFHWAGLDEDRGRIKNVSSRVIADGSIATGLYVAGWARRSPDSPGSHGEDADLVVNALLADLNELPTPEGYFAALVTSAADLDGWSARAAVESLLERFTHASRVPLVDYDSLLEQVDED